MASDTPPFLGRGELDGALRCGESAASATGTARYSLSRTASGEAIGLRARPCRSSSATTLVIVDADQRLELN